MQQKEATTSGPLILIAEDEPGIALMTERMLAMAGFRNTLLAVTAPEVLVRLDSAHNNPDLILLDLNMPGMDGVELLRHIGARNYAGNIALVSGVHHDVLNACRDLAIAHGLNVVGSLTKPVSADDLIAMVESALRVDGLDDVVADVEIIPQDIEDALNNGDFEIHYQPKASIRDQSIIGVEALLRWNHPKLGWISPAMFIPLAEHVGLIGGITEFVLRTAISQAGQWANDGLSLSLAINLSTDCLHELHYPDLIADLAAGAGYSPDLITLEITETKLMRDPIMALEILTRLRIKGFGLSVDDFGTGYLSMDQLRRMPFSELKVDRAFVHDSHLDLKAQAILETSTRLGRQLNLKIVAEGVETQADLDAVSALDCDVVQGFFLSRAMPANQLAPWLRNWVSIGGDQARVN
ncbi:MAG: EAL domain-containing response regulator [Alphaproteobacteria bacterium]|nr:EAL domain-containing response regulator [Alphaproteobacteria bacterium]